MNDQQIGERLAVQLKEVLDHLSLLTALYKEL